VHRIKTHLRPDGLKLKDIAVSRGRTGEGPG
jgi:hypothetical protein